MDSRVQLMSRSVSKRCTYVNWEYWHAFLNAEVKLERSPRLVTCHKRYILKLALIICDLPKSMPG